MIKELRNKTEKGAKIKFFSGIIRTFTKIIRMFHGIGDGLDSGIAFDQRNGHLWLENEDAKANSCACGGVGHYEDMVLIPISLAGEVNFEDSVHDEVEGAQNFRIDNCEKVDVFFVKSKMFETALEVSMSLSSIGMAIQM